MIDFKKSKSFLLSFYAFKFEIYTCTEYSYIYRIF